MSSYYQPISPLKKKTSNQRVITAMLLIVGMIFIVSFLFIWNQGISDSQIEEYQKTSPSKDFDDKFMKIKEDNIMMSENERFGDANNILPTQIEPQVSEPVLEDFDQIPKPSQDKKEK